MYLFIKMNNSDQAQHHKITRVLDKIFSENGISDLILEYLPYVYYIQLRESGDYRSTNRFSGYIYI